MPPLQQYLYAMSNLCSCAITSNDPEQTIPLPNNPSYCRVASVIDRQRKVSESSSSNLTSATQKPSASSSESPPRAPPDYSGAPPAPKNPAARFAAPGAVIVMRHPRRQQLGPLPGRRSVSRALGFFSFFSFFSLFFFLILASPAFALPGTSSISASVSPCSLLAASAPTQLEHSPSRAPSAPGLDGKETPQAAASAASAAAASTAKPISIATAKPIAEADTPSPAKIRNPQLPERDDSFDRGIDLAAAASPPSPPSPSPPPYEPIVTPPPDQDAGLAKMGYSMTTFYTCDTIGGQEHCGWHVPVLKADGPTTRTDVRVVLAVVSCLAGILAWGLV